MSVEPAPGDIVELRRILALGNTPYVEQFLRRELAKLAERFPETAAPPTPPKPSAPKIVYEPIAGYAFSDSKDTASVVISDIGGLDSAEIQFDPTPTSFTVAVHRDGLPNLKLTVSPLYKKILPNSSKFKVKGKTLTIILDKRKKKTWTKLKKGAFDTKKPKPGETKEDPNAALMGLMKKMYDEGDDEMKRTIQKAMWEARNKKEEDKDKDKDTK
jgi:calcyclin binding protein